MLTWRVPPSSALVWRRGSELHTHALGRYAGEGRPCGPLDPVRGGRHLSAILAHGCNLGLYTMEKVAPDITYRRLKYVSA